MSKIHDALSLSYMEWNKLLPEEFHTKTQKRPHTKTQEEEKITRRHKDLWEKQKNARSMTQGKSELGMKN